MAQTQLTDAIIPGEFTARQVNNSLVSTALSQSGVVSNNTVIATQLALVLWVYGADVEAGMTNDDPTDLSTPEKITAGKQSVQIFLVVSSGLLFQHFRRVQSFTWLSLGIDFQLARFHCSPLFRYLCQASILIR